MIDGGACIGDYIRTLRAYGYSGRIFAFEPVSRSFQGLQSMTRADRSLECFRLALGDQCGEITIRISENMVSSSALVFSNFGQQSFEGIGIIESEEVPMTRLDVFLADRIPTADRLLIKLDVQGYELRALAGMQGIWDRVHLLEIELAPRPIYQGAPTMQQLLELLGERSFQCIGIGSNSIVEETAECVEFNCLFARNSDHDTPRVTGHAGPRG